MTRPGHHIGGHLGRVDEHRAVGAHGQRVVPQGGTPVRLAREEELVLAHRPEELLGQRLPPWQVQGSQILPDGGVADVAQGV
jgi:hypothetical protein